MNLKSLIALSASSMLITACSTSPVDTKSRTSTTQQASGPIIYQEPAVSAPFYALNPVNYSQPPEFEVNLHKAAIAPVTPLKITSDPTQPSTEGTILDQNRLIIPLKGTSTKALKYAVLAQENELDVTEIDDFLTILEGKARHYPPQFSVKRERTGMTEKLKSVIATLDQHAIQADASYDVVLRAMKANHIARNLDMGEAYGPKVLGYATRLLKNNPKNPEVNFWFGFGLSEGGALKEATSYLQIAMDAGIQEAHLSMANNFLYLEQKKNALTTLKNYQIKFPDEAATIAPLIAEIESGKRYNVWTVPK